MKHIPLATAEEAARPTIFNQTEETDTIIHKGTAI